MITVRALVVCTGNTCRSPMAAALLAHHLAAVGVDAEVASAGTLGWSSRPATDAAVAVAAELGLDIGGHRSRRLTPEMLDVDLVVAMTRVHAGAVTARRPELAPRVFLPAEYARLAGRTVWPPDVAPADRVAAVGRGRPPGPVGRAAEEIPDPAGEPVEVYRRTAARLDRDLAGLVAALVGAVSPRVAR